MRFAFWREVPPATATLFDHSGTQWEADAAFSFGSGLRDVKDVVGRRHGVRVTVPEEMFFDEGTEWEIIRGSASDESALNNSYQISGDVVSFCRARNEGTEPTPVWFVPEQQARYPATLSIAHATAIAETHPCQKPGTALIALRSRGQNIRNVTAVMARYVMDWDGSGWNTPVISANPALHARQLLSDFVEYARVAQHSRIPRFRDMGTLIDDADFVAWRDQCDAMGARVSYLSQGEPVAMVLQSILAAGLARPSLGARLSIDWFRDRSSEQPAITFSPRNSNLRVMYENPIRPMGVRAKFRNRHKDWREDELEVRALVTGNTGNWTREEIRGIDDPDWLRQRLTFDMLRAEHWRTVYEIETSLEGMALRRGSLIGVVTDLVDDRAHGARVRAVPDPQILDIDQIIPSQQVLPDMSEIGEGFDFDDLFEVGEQSVVLVTTPDGMEMRAIIGSEQVSRGRGRITLDSPLSSTDVKGAHVSIGSLSNRVRRCIVVDESPRDEFSKTVVAADEADPALGFEDAHIPSDEPVATELCGRGRGIVPVAEEHDRVRPPHSDHSGPSLCAATAFLVDVGVAAEVERRQIHQVRRLGQRDNHAARRTAHGRRHAHHGPRRDRWARCARWTDSLAGGPRWRRRFGPGHRLTRWCVAVVESRQRDVRRLVSTELPPRHVRRRIRQRRRRG